MPSRAAATLVLLLASTAAAQVADHLQCFEIKDAVKLQGIVDLDSPQLGVAAGCKVSRAALLCTAAEKAVVSASNGPPIPRWRGW